MNEQSIFTAAMERDPAERSGFLDEACENDRVLRERVEKLLQLHENAGDFLERPAAVSSIDRRTVERPGTLVGRYKLLELIGEGGFGDVYMAEQQEPVRREVALKIIKLGMDTRSVIARFEAERQALALMDHPNIAKVHDAGATETGRPYFVMELVRGIPVTEFCDENSLTTKERLGLFIDVCHAIQHAHQKGIIHRDIKPTNVLVTQQDARPVPKIIDFGVAKATQQRLTEKTLFTEHRQLVGTPEYMSPEQATFCETDVDTRSDIYSLGVLLYELLVGTTPFDAEALRSRGYDEICRVISESDPLTPSRRLSTLGDEDVNDISKHRHVEPAALRRLLRGDLDWIVMKALEKDRTRRYETAHGLARDVERHLGDEPVLARPPSASYRLKKLVRKHRGSVAAGVGIAVALVLGLILTTIGFVRADRARRIAFRERYVSDMNLAAQAWEECNLLGLQELLAPYDPSDLSQDIIGFEWHYLSRLSTFRNSQPPYQLPYRGQRLRFTPNGAVLAIGMADNTILLCDVSVTDQGLKFRERDRIGDEHKILYSPISVAFLPGGKKLVCPNQTADGVDVYDIDSGIKTPLPIPAATTKREDRLEPADSLTETDLYVFRTWITNIAVSPNGRYVAFAADYGDPTRHANLRVWDRIESHVVVDQRIGRLLRTVAFSPDSRRLASCRLSGHVELWNVAQDPVGSSVANRQISSGRVTRYTPNGSSILVGTEDGSVVLLNSTTLDEERRFQAHSDSLRAMRFSPTGDRLATSSRDNVIKLWEWPSCELVSVLKGHAGGVQSCDFHPTADFLVSSSSDGTVICWDLRQIEDREQVDLAGPPLYLTNSNLNRGFYVADTKTNSHWDVDAERLTQQSSSPDTPRRAAIVRKNGEAIELTIDHAIRELNDSSDERTKRLRFEEGVVPIDWSRSGRWLAAGVPGGPCVSVWEVSAGTKIQDLPVDLLNAHHVRPAGLFSTDERIFAIAASDYSIRLFDTQTWKSTGELSGHRAGVVGLAFCPTESRIVASASWDNTARIWDIDRQKCIHQLHHGGWVGWVAFSPDGKRLASVSADQTLKLWSVETGQQLLSINTNIQHPRHVAFSRDGSCIALTSALPNTFRVYRGDVE